MAGERYVYKFVCDPDALFSMAFPDNQRPFLKAEQQDCHVNEDDTLPLTHFEDNSAYLLDLDHCSNLPYAEGFAYWLAEQLNADVERLQFQPIRANGFCNFLLFLKLLFTNTMRRA